MPVRRKVRRSGGRCGPVGTSRSGEFRQDELGERFVVGSAHPGGRVPALDGLEARVADAAVVGGGRAAVAAGGDVVEAGGVSVDKRVEELTCTWVGG